MPTPFEQETSLMQQMGLAPADIDRRLAFVGLTDDDRRRLTQLSDVMSADADALTSTFFDHLASLHEARGVIDNGEVLASARRLKTDHLRAMAAGEYGAGYVEARLKLGVLYAKVGLDPRVFLGAFQHLLAVIGAKLMERRKGREREAFDQFLSLQKIAFFDVGLIVDVIVFERERLIRQQQDAIRELSTPVLQVRDRLLILPIIGVIDTQRARQITESLLHAIRSHRAKVVVVDITGVPGVDSRVANHLMQTVMAARLMGTTAIVTGLSAEVAQALVTLGVSLGEVTTAGDLQGGLEEAEGLLGYQVVQHPNAASHARS